MSKPINIVEVAAICGVSDHTIRRWRRKPGFPKPLFPNHMMRTLLFDRAEIEHWVKEVKGQQ